MSLKAWLQKNQVFDKDLLILFPQYGVNEPEKDLKNLTPDQWKKIQAQIKKDRAKELKANQAKIRLQKKLTKIEKLWRAKRPKKKVKAPKLLSLFADSAPTKKPNGSPTKKKAKNKKDQKLTAVDKEKEELWDQYHTLKLSDNEREENEDSDNKNDENTSYNMPALESQGSVVDMLLNVGTNQKDETPDVEAKKVDIEDKKEEKPEKKEDNDNKDEHKDKNDKNEWDYDDALRFSDDDSEEEEIKKTEDGPSLFVPMFKLKTQGSVVDMLMDGPYDGHKHKIAPTVAKVISVTPPSPTQKDAKDYSITVTVSCDDDVKEEDDTQPSQSQQEIEANQTDETNEATIIAVGDDDKKEESAKKVGVSLNADVFVYNESRDTYSLSLSGCKLMQSDFINGTLTFEIKKSFVNLDKSEGIEKGMDSDDKYIENVLDEIHKNNPDTETED